MHAPVECRECNDAGYVFDTDKNMAFPCKACADRFQRGVRATLRRLSGVPDKYQAATLDGPVSRHADLPRMYAAGKVWAERSGRPWLLVIGKRGCGKTQLASACINHLCDTEYEAQFLTSFDFLDEARARQADFGASEQYQKEIAALPFLAFDELGVGDIRTDWGAETVERLLLRRYNKDMPTIITTNLSFEQIEARMERAASRMLESAEVIIVTKGKDLREGGK